MIDNINAKFADELNPGDRILWSGQPQQGLIFRQSDILMIPFGLLWGGFAIYWESRALSSGVPIFFVIWGIPNFLVGLYLIIGRYFVDCEQRRRTFYALTHDRAIIVSGLFSQKYKSIRFKKLSEINLSISGDGKGTITFGPSHPMAWWYSGMGLPNMGRYRFAPYFELVENGKSVYQLIKRIQIDEI